MADLANPELPSWESFYVIVGSSGAALVGLQFVAMTLIADRSRRVKASADAIGGFSTPTVVHLTSALAVAAIMSAPWERLLPVCIALGLWGAGGLAYCAVVLRRTRRQKVYQPVWGDWVWYVALPSVAYLTLALAPLFFRDDPHFVAFFIASAALGLLLIGIRNAWDTVSHLALGHADIDHRD